MQEKRNWFRSRVGRICTRVRRSSSKVHQRLRLDRLEDRTVPAVGDLFATGAGTSGGPHIKVFDAETGALRFEFSAYDPTFTGGVRVAIADVTGSNAPDIITGPGPGGGPVIRIFDGSTRQMVREFNAFDPAFRGGVTLAAADFTGDGKADIVVAPDTGGGPVVRVFDGASGAMITEFNAYDPSFRGGVNLAVGDVTGDGVPDIVTGAGFGGGPHVRVFDGASLPSANVARQFFAYDQAFRGGVFVAVTASGDALNPAGQIVTGPGEGGGPHVKVFSVNSGNATTTSQFLAFPTAFAGGVRVASANAAGNSEGALFLAAGPDKRGADNVGPYVVMTTTAGALLRSDIVYELGFNGGVYAGRPSGVTFVGSRVAEGSAGQVSFGNLTYNTSELSFSYDFNADGVFEIQGSPLSTATVPASYLSDGPGTRTVVGRIHYGPADFVDYRTEINVHNVPPTVQMNGSFSGAPGASTSFSATVTDPSPVDTAAGFTYTWNFGDGSATSSQVAPSHIYAAAGTYTVNLTVRDKDGGMGTATATVSIANSNPQATFSGSTANEGGTGTVSFSNPSGGSGGYRYSYDFDNDGTFEITNTISLTATVPASYLDDGPGSRVVRGRIGDSSGAFTDYTATVNILNVPPTVQAGGPYSGAPGAAVSFSATVTDPSPVDTAAGFTYTWNFGDGSATSSLASPSHVYTTAGTYTVNLTVRDKDGGTGTATATVTVTASNLQATFTGGNANEGSTGQVAFSNVSGGAGGYRYSYDFNNDGTFEITDSTSPNATVPASYLSDGPGTQVVRGRVRDSADAFKDYTASITIANVPPTVQLAGPFNGSPGVPISFSANVTDPSPVDTAAGFTYLWNFGGGVTSTQASPSHTYSTTGTYTVSVTVRDKDNGATTATASVTVGSTSTSFIITPFDKIPNFGANPTVTAVASGNWSSPSTWSGNQIPAAGAIVAIPSNRTVIYDVVSDVALNTVAIQPGGVLRFSSDINTRLTVVNFLVMQGGTLEIGTEANPVAANVRAEVVFPNVPLNTAADPSQYGHGLVALGKVTMHGAIRDDSFIRLATEPQAGHTALALTQPATGWQVGDRLYLPDSRHWAIESESYTPRYEDATIAAISADGKTITLAAPLQFAHPGARDGSNVLEFLPHVGNRTRNVVIRSADSAGTRGHAFFTYRADVDVRYAGFGGLGRTRIGNINNTTYNGGGAVTHVGTNQDDRFPVHFAHLFGPQSTPANGFQFTFVGNAVFCAMPTHNFKWGLTINDSHYGLVQDNFVVNWAGAGIATKTGNESFNVISENFSARGRGQGDREGSGNPGSEGSAFWFRGPNNYVRDNVGANYVNNEAEAAYGFKLYFVYLGNILIPNFKGADTSVSGQYATKNGNAMPLLEFARNEAYGVENAYTIWWLNAVDTNPQNGGTSVVKDFVGWHISRYGFYGYPMADVVFDGYVIRGSKAALSNQHEFLTGMWFGDYMTKNVVVRNADIQNMRTGIVDPYFGGFTTIIEDSYLRNSKNISVRTLGAPGSSPNGNARQPKNLIIRNVLFGSTSGWNLGGATPYNISMDYMTHEGSANLVKSDTVFVYDYNGVAGDNFQVFYNQQAPDFTVPQSNGNLVGSPVAGLTNQQNWYQYSIAIAGAVATNTTTRTGIRGLVRAVP